ncbi:MAG: YicC/YloC family endoribonuclease [Phycisphaerales bacterium]
MIRSMTGFGDASGDHDGAHFSVEVRSVNNKYCKVVLRLPESLQGLEPELDAALRRRLGRGTITLTVKCAETGESAAHEINRAALDKYIAQLKGVAGGAGADLSVLLTLPGVLQPSTSEEEWLEAARKATLPLLDQALTHLDAMRRREGMALGEELMTHRREIAGRLEEIGRLAPGVVAEYERRLQERIQVLLDGKDVGAEPADFVREIAVYAEKTDIAEEIARLREHMAHFEDLLGSGDDRPLGRTLDFLAQEMLREANTIASKSPDARIARLIVEIKGSIDRIKEQVQNVE